MGLRDAVSGRRLVVQPLPDPGLTARLAETLAANGMGGEPRPDVDLNAVADRFIVCVNRGSDPELRDWNRIAWCLWTTDPAVADDDRALDAVLGRVARMQRSRPYRQLASVYLMDFAPDRPRLDRVARVLGAHAPAAGAPWATLQAKYGLFDGMEGPLRVAKMALAEKVTLHRLLESVGIRGPLIEGGFAEAAQREGLEQLRKATAQDAAEHLEVVRNWCLHSDDTLIFRSCRIPMARAIVHPLGDRELGDVARNDISRFLVDRFGDPRIKPAGWIGLDDVADVVKRWLTEQSLRQFFDIVDQIAHPDQWRYRRAFWWAFHEARLIRNAWVIFGRDGADVARRSFGSGTFGVFRTGGQKQVGRDHAVLLMDFGQCVVADWSHNGYCNVWASSDTTRPRNLNASSYTSSEVWRKPPPDQSEANLNRHDIFSHVGSTNYVWQNRVALRLYELIGVRVPQSSYRAD